MSADGAGQNALGQNASGTDDADEQPGGFVLHNLSRRGFLRDAGLVSAGVASGLCLGIEACTPAPPRPSYAYAAGGSGAPPVGGVGGAPGVTQTPPPVVPAQYKSVDPLWVSIGNDGTVQLTVHRSEMGQGVRTACAMLLAEELGARWEDVRVIQASGDPQFGNQNTDSSLSIAISWLPLRTAGATAREMLAQAAANALQVPRAELQVADSKVTHAGSQRSMSFFELADAAAKLPVPAAPALKDASQFRIIGRPNMQGLDACDVVAGKAIYGIDVQVPGMLYASLERSPTRSGTIKRLDPTAAMAVPDVVQVVQLDAAKMGPLTNQSVAVVAKNTWAALQGRSKLVVEWDFGTAPLESSDSFRTTLAQAVMKPGMMVRAEGDADAALAMADQTKLVEASYRGPYLAHAPMEVPVCVAHVQGDRCEIWAPTQSPQSAFPMGVRESVAMMLGIPPQNVRVSVTLLGGAFGRKSQMDFVLEAVQLSKQLGAPVKVTWTRQDELQHGFYRPENQQLLRAALGPSGEVTALLGRSVFQSFFNLFAPGNIEPSPYELDMGWTNLPFAIPNLRLEAAGIASDVRIGWLRSVHNTFHAFALGSFVDELAKAAGTDAVTMYRKLLGPPREVPITVPLGANVEPAKYSIDTGRLTAVVDKVTSMGLWGKPVPAGEGIGFAAHFSFRSAVALVLHVAVGADQKIVLKQADYAIDCGTVVNPDGVQAQAEGALVYGLSAALFGEITLKDGQVQQTNFDSYEVLRMDRMPKVNVATIPSTQPPTGVGEPPTPVVAPALANAVFAATGKRVRELPFKRSGFG